MEYGKIVYESYISKKFDKNIGSSNLPPAPFNILMPIFIVILSVFKSRMINKRIANLIYFCYLSLCFVFFLLGNLLLAIFAWLKITYAIIIGRYIQKHRKVYPGILKHTLHLITWIAFGFVFLIFIVFIWDCPNFFRNGFENIDNRNKIKAPTREAVFLIKKILINIEQSELKDLTLDQFIEGIPKNYERNNSRLEKIA